MTSRIIQTIILGPRICRSYGVVAHHFGFSTRRPGFESRYEHIPRISQFYEWRGEGDSNPRGTNPTGLAIQRNGQAMRPPLRHRAACSE